MRLRVSLVVAVASVMLAVPARAAFPGVNGRIAFTRTLPSGVSQIFSAASDGSGQVNLSNNPAVNDCTPSYSRDGKLIAFERGNDCTSAGPGAIVVMSADGSNQHQVTAPGPNEIDAQPRFSPDGRRIVFEQGSTTSANEVLAVVNVDGSGLHQLETPPAGFGDETPRWSPDGTKIAFMREPVDDSSGQLAIANADGSGAATILSTPPTGFKDGDPSWSPDGSKLLFARSPNDSTTGIYDIYVVGVKGAGQTNLTNESSSTIENEDPAFSPDGSLIVYGRADGTTNAKQLYVMNADGSNKHAITAAVANQFDGEPDWQSPLQTLSVTKTGTGSGIVTSTPGGLNCGSTCSAQFNAGETVTLTATPASGSSLASWSGAGCSGAGACTVTMRSDKSVTATFTAARPMLSSLGARPAKVSTAGRRVHGKCVKPTKKNARDKPCLRPVRLKISYTLSASATVTFKLTRQTTGRKVKGKCVPVTKKNRAKRHCTRTSGVPGSIMRMGKVGANSFTFNGKIAGKTLGPGIYTLTATPAGGAPRKIKFRIMG